MPNNDIQFVQIGGLKVSINAFLTFIAGLVFSVVVTIVMPFGAFAGMYILLIFTLFAYNVNCVQVGHCKTWAWILTILYVIYVVFLSIMLISNKESFLKSFSSVKGKTNIRYKGVKK